MKTLALGDDTYLVSDEVAHHVEWYRRLLAVLNRQVDVTIPVRISATEQRTVVLTLSRDSADPIVTDYDGGLAEPDDPDRLTDMLEEEALTLLDEIGEIVEHHSMEWQRYTRERRG